MKNTVFKGDIIHTIEKDRFTIHEDSYIIVEEGKVKEITSVLEEVHKDYELVDYSGKLIIPGFIDLHYHAPQYPNIGLGMDKELIPWLNTYTFPEEAKFSDLEYARKVFKKLLNDLWEKGTTRGVVFSSVHKESTEMLMDMFIESGLGAYVGKVNMDMNTNEDLTEDTKTSLKETEEIILKYKDKSELVKPIITPRFIPTCSVELLEGLGKMAEEYDIKVQSHINENTSEVIWVQELYPESKNYASVYDDFNLFGQSETIMAHCIYNTDEETDLMVKNGVYAAHCPFSNFNLSSGMMPARKYLDKGMKIGLGSDVSGGHALSIADVIVGTIQSSKMVWLQSDKEYSPLTLSEAFYLATKGGGEFFGKVGSFEEGYEFDALVIDVEEEGLDLEEKLQKFIYNSEDKIIDRYVKGNRIDRPYEV